MYIDIYTPLAINPETGYYHVAQCCGYGVGSAESPHCLDFVCIIYYEYKDWGWVTDPEYLFRVFIRWGLNVCFQ